MVSHRQALSESRIFCSGFSAPTSLMTQSNGSAIKKLYRPSGFPTDVSICMAPSSSRQPGWARNASKASTTLGAGRSSRTHAPWMLGLGSFSVKMVGGSEGWCRQAEGRLFSSRYDRVYVVVQNLVAFRHHVSPWPIRAINREFLGVRAVCGPSFQAAVSKFRDARKPWLARMRIIIVSRRGSRW